MELTRPEQMLLQAIAAALRGEKVTWEQVEEVDWTALMELAARHKIQPLVFQAVYDCPGAATWQGKTVQLQMAKHLTVLQTLKTTEFLSLYARLTEGNIRPYVLKGILCRDLYPNGDLRQSSDEDLYLPGDGFERCCKALTDDGMLPTSDEDASTAEELGWRKKDSYLYLEVHRTLFDSKSAAIRALEPVLKGAEVHAEPYALSTGDTVWSLSPQDHLLYLLLHAYKHFIHSGFGIRQVADIGLWAKHYDNRINWDTLYAQCENAHILKFSVAVFQISKRHLQIELTTPPKWDAVQTDELPMLRDLLDAGVYGSADKNREHSAGVTLNAVSAKHSKQKTCLLRLAFPTKKALERDYPELKAHPLRLPLVWVKRLINYRKETKNSGTGSAAEAWKLAQERKNLLKQYEIL